jgi:hypothetical protein
MRALVTFVCELVILVQGHEQDTVLPPVEENLNFFLPLPDSPSFEGMVTETGLMAESSGV